jgi:hypothetical protein
MGASTLILGGGPTLGNGRWNQPDRGDTFRTFFGWYLDDASGTSSGGVVAVGDSTLSNESESGTTVMMTHIAADGSVFTFPITYHAGAATPSTPSSNSFGSFVGGFREGVVGGIVGGVALGALATISAPLAITVGGALAIHSLYQWAEGGFPITSRGAGQFFGGLAGGGVGGRTGIAIGNGVRAGISTWGSYSTGSGMVALPTRGSISTPGGRAPLPTAAQIGAPGRFNTTVGSMEEALALVRQAYPNAVELPEAQPGLPYGNVPAGVTQWFRIEPAEPNVGNMLPHIKFADWTHGGKRNGGSWGHIFFNPPE